MTYIYDDDTGDDTGYFYGEEEDVLDGYETATEAAQRLGYSYEHMTRILNGCRVPGAQKWQGRWLVPASVSREDVERPVGRPRKEKT